MSTYTAMPWRRLALVVAMLFYLLSASVAWAAGPLTLSQYRDTVNQALQLVEQAATVTGTEARQSLLNQAADLISQVREVQLDDGTRVPVDNTELATQIRRDSSKPEDARARLQALRTTLTALPTSASESDRAKLHDLLSKPPFRNPQDPDWLIQLERQIADLIDHLLASTVQGVYDTRDLITFAGIVLILAVVIFLFFNLRRNIVAEETLATENVGAGDLTARGVLNHAQELAGAGDYRAAVRELYLATLLLLDERGRLRFDHALTNREYLQQAAEEPTLAGALQPIVEAFDRIWYGFEAVTPEEFELYRQHVEVVRKL